jgi:hypothetical protein
MAEQRPGGCRLSYEPRLSRRGWWKIDWLLVITAIPCGAWVVAMFAFSLGQRPDTYLSPKDDVIMKIVLALGMSFPAIVLFLVVVLVRRLRSR